jgi:hypothetical protein
MRIQLLVSPGDAALEAQARALIAAALAAAGVDASGIDVVRVTSDEEAIRHRCLGSPTIRVEGFDVEYAEREPPERTAGARFYSTPAGWQRLPEQGMILFAINEAKLRLAGR